MVHFSLTFYFYQLTCTRKISLLTFERITDNDTNYENGYSVGFAEGSSGDSLDTMSWSTIQTLVKDGTLLDYVAIGDTKMIRLNDGQYVMMRLVSINDGTGCTVTPDKYYPNHTADFMAQTLLKSTYQMYASGNNLGWKNTTLRNTLNTTIYDLIPQEIKDVMVDRIHRYATKSDASTVEDVTDHIWLPTQYELGRGAWNAVEGNQGNKVFQLYNGKWRGPFSLGIDNGQSPATGCIWTSSVRQPGATSGSNCMVNLVNSSGDVTGSSEAVNRYGVNICFRVG